MPRSPLFLDGWVEFTRRERRLQPVPMRFTKEGNDFPAIRAVHYLDRHGRIRVPSLHPYLPVSFEPTLARSRRKRDAQRLGVAAAEAIHRRTIVRWRLRRRELHP